MAGTIYLRTVTTLGGNRGHELVLMVSKAALAKARQAAEDARRRANEARSHAEHVRARNEAARAREAQTVALGRMCAAWIADLVKGGQR